MGLNFEETNQEPHGDTQKSKTASFSNFILSVREMKIKSWRSHPSLHIRTKLTPRNELKVYGKNKTDS